MKRENKFALTTPLLYLVFNRPDLVKKTFPEIQKAKPKQLFIAADGPRNPEEKKKTDAVRRYILKNITWKCDVKTLFRDKNLGCKYAVSSAIDWFFENVEQGIILEDDCLPSQSFFRFCQEMLERYGDDKKIMHISGTNVEGISNVEESYFFSDTFNVWGWATWKRAWKGYDVEMKTWKRIRFSKTFSKMLGGGGLFQRLKSWRLYQLTYAGKINTWDYQWDFLCSKNKALSIIPKKNLITNLGFREGTHTTNYRESDKSISKYEIRFPTKKIFRKDINKKYTKFYLGFFGRPFQTIALKKLFKW